MASPDSNIDQSTVTTSSEVARSRLEATRYLAAAAHCDYSFRKAVLNQVDGQKYRCRAPEFGINDNLVLRECRNAERNFKTTSFFLFLILVYLFYTGFLNEAIDIILLAPEYLLEVFVYFESELLIAYSAMFVCCFVFYFNKNHNVLRKEFSSQCFYRSPDSNEVTVSHRQNLVVYGEYLPFVGSGLKLRDWSFSVNLHRSAISMSTPPRHPLNVEKLTRAVRNSVEKLNVSTLHCYDVIFYDGKYVRNDRDIMPSEFKIPSRVIDDNVEFCNSVLIENYRRKYLCIEVNDWSGELVLTFYLRIKHGESSLFVESSSFIMPPLKKKYYNIDTIDPELRITELLSLIGKSLFMSPFWLAFSPVTVLLMLYSPFLTWSENRNIRKQIKRNPIFNFGALTSVRLLGIDDKFRVYFQQLDRDRHQKTIEQCVIDSIVDCLDAHGIDTSDIKERRASILNNGVIISGGVVNADNIAAGTGAKAKVARYWTKGSEGSK